LKFHVQVVQWARRKKFKLNVKKGQGLYCWTAALDLYGDLLDGKERTGGWSNAAASQAAFARRL
jgi:hypothetical protein